MKEHSSTEELSDGEIQERLDELSLARVRQHFDSDEAIAIITAFHPDLGPAENAVRNLRLAQWLRKAYGYIWLDGIWIDEGTGGRFPETSMLAIGNANDSGRLRGVLSEAARDYNQDMFAYRIGGHRDIRVMDRQGAIAQAFENADWNNFGEIYSCMRGGLRPRCTFVFERAWIAHDGFGTRLADARRKPDRRTQLLRRLHDFDYM